MSLKDASCPLPPVIFLFLLSPVCLPEDFQFKIETSVFCPARLKQQNVGFYGKPSPSLDGKAWLQLFPKKASLKPSQNGQPSHSA